MEINKTKLRGYDATLLYTGSRYILHSNYFGVLAIAERGYLNDSANYIFHLYVGNRNTLGGSLTDSVIESSFKRLINSSERRWHCKEIEYRVKYVDNHKVFTDLEIINSPLNH